MKNKDLAKRVKDLRMRKGFSQEELAEDTGLSLRTIQRIENGETEPRGDTLKRLANSFGVTPDEIVVWTMQEDRGFLIALNLSALCVLLFPVFGILIPLIMWISKKDKIKDINIISKDVINFQITWLLVYFGAFIYIILRIVFAFDAIEKIRPVTPELVQSKIWSIDDLKVFGLFFGFMILYNIVLVVYNTLRISKNKDVKYYPKIRFLY